MISATHLLLSLSGCISILLMLIRPRNIRKVTGWRWLPLIAPAPVGVLHLPPRAALKALDVCLFLNRDDVAIGTCSQHGVCDWLRRSPCGRANGPAHGIFALVYAAGTFVTSSCQMTRRPWF